MVLYLCIVWRKTENKLDDSITHCYLYVHILLCCTLCDINSCSLSLHPQMTRITRRSVLASRALKRRWSRSVSVIVEIVKPSAVDDVAKMPNIINFLSTMMGMLRKEKPRKPRVESIVGPELPVPITAGNG